MKKKYPLSLFIMGFVLNMVRGAVFIAIAVTLMIVGIWLRPCLYIGLGLIAVVIIVSLIMQLRYRHAILYSNDPELESVREAILNGDWKGNIKELVSTAVGSDEKTKKYLALTADELREIPDDELFDAVLCRTEHIVDGFDDMTEGINALNESQRILYSVNYLEIEVNNGGLCQFFVNSSRVVAPYVSEYLGIIGADEHKKLYDGFVSANKIDLNDLSSFEIGSVRDYEKQTKRYPFDDFDNAYYELRSLEEYLTVFAKAHIEDF